mmetsp:Transcript_21321/g.63654  ORF Transcript_21321/g.63654 Transcript_21321/m.63654 type:complete len:218 (-) Transcript_21321:146-799(-)
MPSALRLPKVLILVLLAVDRDAVSVVGLANQPVRGHHLARRRLRSERVAQRGEGEVNLLLARHGGSPDEAGRRLELPARRAHLKDLGAPALPALARLERDAHVLDSDGRLARVQPRGSAAAGQAVHKRCGGLVWRVLDADRAARGGSLDDDIGVRHKGAAHLHPAPVERQQEGGHLPRAVDRDVGVREHVVDGAVLAAEVRLASVGKVQVRVAGEAG